MVPFLFDNLEFVKYILEQDSYNKVTPQKHPLFRFDLVFVISDVLKNLIFNNSKLHLFHKLLSVHYKMNRLLFIFVANK